MTPETFLKLLVGHAWQFKSMIETGAQWELAAHVAITEAIRAQTGKIPVREMKYKTLAGPEMGDEACDLVFQDGTEIVALELKVESATNQGQFAGLNLKKVTSLDEGVNADVKKLSTLSEASFKVEAGEGPTKLTFQPSKLHRWVLVIAWSPKSVGQLKTVKGTNIFTDASTGLMFWLASV